MRSVRARLKFFCIAAVLVLPASSRSQSWCEYYGVWEPAWSPDGSYVATSGWLFHGPPLYLIEFWVRVHQVEAGAMTSSQEMYYGISSRPTWSPDSREVVVTNGPRLMAMSLDERRSRTIATLNGEILDPAWSPDGAWIAFTLREYGVDDEIYVVNPAGQDLRRLTLHSAADRHPAWSPDSRSIAFTSNRGGDDDIWTVSPNGGEPVQLTEGPANDTWPTWSPDGRFLAFASDRAGQDIWVLPVGRRDPVRITQDAAFATAPAWSPDGAWIAYRSVDGLCENVRIIAVPRIIAIERISWGDLKQLYR
jgi:TolB protein